MTPRIKLGQISPLPNRCSCLDRVEVRITSGGVGKNESHNKNQQQDNTAQLSNHRTITENRKSNIKQPKLPIT